jgi:hypothetical protein
MNDHADGGFLSRWSRRKVQARDGVALPEPAAPPREPTAIPASVQVPPAAVALAPPSVDAATAPPQAVAPEPARPTMDDVATLTRESDFSRFVSPGVDGDVKNAALKKLFTDPHFNVMDGLDTYIEDYGRPDPLPPSMLRQMAQAQFLGLFREEKEPADATPPEPHDPPATATLAPPAPTDEDPDLRLQPHDAAGPAGTAPGAVGEPGRG